MRLRYAIIWKDGKTTWEPPFDTEKGLPQLPVSDEMEAVICGPAPERKEAQS